MSEILGGGAASLDWSAELSIALTQLLGIAAIVGSLIVWRAIEFVPASRRARALWAADRRGVLVAESRMELAKLSVRSILIGVGVYLSLHFFFHVFQYLQHANWIVREQTGLDSAQIRLLRDNTRTLLQHTTTFGTVTSALCALDWLVQLLTGESRPIAMGADVVAPEAIPESWSGAPRALWEYRAQGLVASGMLSLRDAANWPDEWAAWTSLVVAHRKRVIRTAVALSESHEE